MEAQIKQTLNEGLTNLRVSGITRTDVANYYKQVLKLIEDGKIEIHEGALYIADTMFNPIVDQDEKLEDIALTAGLLEIPPTEGEAAIHNIDQEYKTLKQLIGTL
ncbi:hypothetical protein KJ836_01750 [Patescibacteria group bacterium]|nr:hypothetical protein [Patescibacteria group bacterium]